MTLGIMQPYFLPYIGYFQLMKAVDAFVLYDDVTYIKQGWINRNRILLNNNDYLFTLELKGASSNKNINSVEVGNNRIKLLKTFDNAYRKAPFYEQVKPLLDEVFYSNEVNLAKYIAQTISAVNKYLGIDTKMLMSSELDKNNLLKGQDKVIEICKILNAQKYINSIGGQDLYSKKEFSDAGIELVFITPQNINYKQYSNNFIPFLSILDVLMFNSIHSIQEMLNMYDLL